MGTRAIAHAKGGVALAVTGILSWALRAVQLFGYLCRSWTVDRLGPSLPDTEEGITVIIPERDAPDMLGECMAHAFAALNHLDGRGEVIVVLNGSEPEAYAELRQCYRQSIWIHHNRPLSFSDAVREGLAHARYNWVFLLNNDMLLDVNALQQLWRHRARHVFAVACQVFFQDPMKRREETGLTALATERGLHGLFDREPFSADTCVGHLYAGGGASLFQRQVLRQMVESNCAYAPFYWEDVDWGIRAQQRGYEILFEPSAVAHHRHRATISRFYSAAEVDRIFERNALICGLTYGWYRPGLSKLAVDLAKHRYAFFQPRRLRRLFRGRFATGATRSQVRYFHNDIIKFVPLQRDEDLPWLILVSPYALYPRHGSAVRIDAIVRHLAKHFRIVLVADEGWTFEPSHIDKLACFDAVHLIVSPRCESNDTMRRVRMRNFARRALKEELKRVIVNYRPKLIQVEHEELCGLVDLKSDEHWFITLHDVNLGQSSRADRYLLRKLKCFDGVIACSKQDHALLGPDAALIENGVDTHRFRVERPSSGFRMLFIGGFSYPPNQAGVQRLIEKCLTQIVAAVPSARLVVLGGADGMSVAELAPFNHPSVEFVAYTDDVRLHLERAALTVNPLRNIRGSCLKTIESLIAGRVCVSTPEAARGWEAYDFPGLLIAENDQAFIRLVIEMLTEPRRRRALETQRPDGSEPFDWAQRAAKQLELYHRV